MMTRPAACHCAASMREHGRRSLWTRLLFSIRRRVWCRFCQATMLMPPPAPLCEVGLAGCGTKRVPPA